MLLMIYSDCVGPQLTGFPTPFEGQNERPSDTKVVSLSSGSRLI